MNIKRLSAIICLIAICWTAKGDDLFYKNIGIAEGLSQNSVTALEYDNHGSLWIGTRFGLNEFRSQQIHTFYGDGEEGLQGDYIHALYLDSQDDLWVSTEKGTQKYDRHTGTFTLLHDIPFLCAMETRDIICFGSPSGIFIHDGNGFVDVPLGGLGITHLFAYGKHLIMTDMQKGVYRANLETIFSDPAILKSTIRKMELPFIEDMAVMDATIIGSKLLLSVYRNGIIMIDLDGKEPNRYFNTNNSNLSYDIVLDMTKVGNELWLGTDGGGVDVLDLNTETIEKITYPVNSVTTITADPFGNIWTGSVRNGAIGIKRTNNIKQHSVSSRKESGNVINSLWNDGSNLWIGTDGDGVKRLDKRTGKIYDFPTTSRLKISSLAKMDANHLLISAYSRGLISMNIWTGSISEFTLVDKQTTRRESFNANPPFIYEVEGHLLIMVRNTYDYDVSTGKFTAFTTSDRLDHPHLNICSRYDSDSEAEMPEYAFTTSCIFSLDMDRHILEKQVPEIGGETIFSAARIDSTMWIGTQHGLFSMNLNSSETTRFNTNQFSRITNLRADSYGNLWVAADNSLFRMQGSTVQYFGENEGFAQTEILSTSTGNDSSEGPVFLPSTDGLIEITNPDIQLPESSKMLELHDVSVGGKKVQPKKNAIKVPFRFNEIKVSVSLPDTDPFDRYMYRYTFEGKPEYSMEQYESTIILNELREGTYKLQASYLGRDGKWSEPSDILRIRVLAPWYRSILFIILVTLIGGSLLYYMIRIIYKRQVAKMEKKIREENDSFLNKFNGYLSEHLSESELDVKDIARHMAMSRTSLYEKVKKVSGRSVGQYIDEMRLEEAIRLLSETDNSITEVSEQVGFASARYFSTWFKKYKGVSPRQYRSES